MSAVRAAWVLAAWSVCSLAQAAPRSVASRAAAPGASDAEPVNPEPAQPQAPEPVAPGVGGPAAGGGESGGALGPLTPMLDSVTTQLREGRPKEFPVHMEAYLDTSVGTGSFILKDGLRQPSLSNMVRLTPSLTIWKSLRASMRLVLTKEWIRNYGQTTTAPNPIMMQDLWLGLGMGEIYRESVTGIGVGAGVWTFAPTSIQSRADTLIVGVRPWGAITWKKWGFDASYNFSVRQNFHQYRNPTVDSRPGFYECGVEGRCFVGEVNAGFASRAGDNINLPGGRQLDPTRRNNQFVVYNTAVLAYTAFDVLTLSATAMLISAYKYRLEADPTLTSINAGNNERGHSDLTWGVLDATFAPWEHVAFSTGVYSVQPFYSAHRGSGIPGWTQNGQQMGASNGTPTPLFPFFDLITPGNNYTAVYFDITLTI